MDGEIVVRMGRDSVAVIFSVFDGDRRHFVRFLTELERLDLPYAVNLDHCSRETKAYFKCHPLCIGAHENDDPTNPFDESHRQNALEIVQRLEFGWALSMDVDETLERRAPELIRQAIRMPYDIIDFMVLDLWGDGQHYRVDGPFKDSHREKLFRLRGNKVRYYHPTVHAPKVAPYDGTPARVLNYHPIRVLHWGIMKDADVKEHTERWDTIYTRAVGGNPYAGGFYGYINSPDAVPLIKEVPNDV